MTHFNACENPGVDDKFDMSWREKKSTSEIIRYSIDFFVKYFRGIKKQCKRYYVRVKLKVPGLQTSGHK